MTSLQLEKREEMIDVIGLFGIVTFSLFYSLYRDRFAELHIQLPFLDFPIFVGEILLGVCLLLVVVKLVGRWQNHTFRLQSGHYLLLAYVGWLVVKAFVGYQYGGSLAFRNAALYYYPLYAFLGYYFFNRALLTQRLNIFLLCFLCVILLTEQMYLYFRFPYLMFYILLALNLQKRSHRMLGILVTLLVCGYRFGDMFAGSRSHLVGIMAAFVFLALYAFFYSRMLTKQVQFGIFVGMVGMMSLGLVKYADQHALQTFLKLKPLTKALQQRHDMVVYEEPEFVVPEIQPNLYNKNVDRGNLFIEENSRTDASQVSADKMRELDNMRIMQTKQWLMALEKKSQSKESVSVDQPPERVRRGLGEVREGPAEVSSAQVSSQLSERLQAGSLQALEASLVEKEAGLYDKIYGSDLTKVTIRDIDTAYNNVVFRLFLWRDMFMDMVEDKAWMGVNLGKPQRSLSLEIFGWARSEWERDGWVTPHNSYFHIIYRGGIVGLVMIVLIFRYFFQMGGAFVRHHNFKGALLMSICIYWAALAFFLVFLEFPYSAIPFWSLFGMVLAYGRNLSSQPVQPQSALKGRRRVPVA